MKYTKGKWELNKEKRHPWKVECDTNIPGVKGEVCVVFYKPNAKLIASAPELLEACKEVCACVYRNGELTFENSAWKLLIQAIEKAMD